MRPGFEGDAGGFNVHHLREFLRGFCNHVGANLHVRVLSGKDTHHVCEAVMKAFAKSLYVATRVTSNELPSTKGLALKVWNSHENGFARLRSQQSPQCL